jgi:hypothetical protein
MFEKYDVPARDKIISILGDNVYDNPDIYGADLIFKNNDDNKIKYKYLELQVCANWSEDKYPYENLWIYERKGKYNTDTLLMTLNRDLTMCYIFDLGKLNLEKDIRRLKKYSREFVYDIKWNQTLKIYLEYLDMDTLKQF